ncbi:LTXXQ motif family protein [Noviherbaspirillum humi]|uniref:LTXXQ motif family protein n=2 Tax=Noviherbaspirillum humi TaxID=1688639 RepID=A0A239EVN9_9BURK|nr:LTXXQ motif family protein [Noviherbaspirillum humi]
MHPVFRALHVSDMQREQIQNIGRNQAARLNDLYRTLASAKTALAALTRNGQFHDTQAKPHTDRLGAAMAEIALVRARSESEVIALLTPQQRQRLDQLRRQGTLDPATSIE